MLPSLKEQLSGCVALDCGASPGGWTSYLAGEMKCARIYSGDPGELSKNVRDMDRVRHMQMRIDGAFDLLLQE